MSIFVIYLSNSPHSVFPPSNQTPTKKVFLPVFSQKFSIHPISSPNKHTVGILDMLFGLWPYVTFLYPTSKKSHTLLGLIITGGTLTTSAHAYKA